MTYRLYAVVHSPKAESNLGHMLMVKMELTAYDFVKTTIPHQCGGDLRTKPVQSSGAILKFRGYLMDSDINTRDRTNSQNCTRAAWLVFAK